MKEALEKKWWKEAVGYQIYPKSFNDTNGDGIGDIRGIIEKLDYLNRLGVNMLWICPIYRSPMDDNGYDVSDYFDIAPEFGTLSDMKELLAEAKKRNIRIIMDLVLNHTSDEHPWFIEARQSKESKYRDYYIWQEGKLNTEGEEIEPTNWASFFTPSCWKKDELTNEYFMHIFSRKMPDLNWSNDEMRQELYNMVSWWLDLGIDGFRVDAIAHIDRDFTFTDSIDETLRQGNYYQDWGRFSNLPKVHTYLKEFNAEVLSKYDIFTVGEVGGGADIDAALRYTAVEEKELNTAFTFDHCWFNQGFDSLEPDWDGSIDLVGLKQAFAQWQVGLYGKAWNPLYWLNHDHPRVMSQYGDEVNYPKESGKMLATTLHMMWGIPFLYNGEEIGMTNAHFTDFEDYRDVSTCEKIKNLLAAGEDEALVRRHVSVTSRDNARTPMQWDTTENAGFTSGEPWMKVNPNYQTINVATQLDDETSLFNHYRQVIALRRHSEYKEIIVYGTFELVAEEDEAVFAYVREYEGRRLAVVSNFFKEETSISLPLEAKQIILSNYEASSTDLSDLTLRPFESIIFELKA